MTDIAFLSDLTARKLTTNLPSGLVPVGLFVGNDPSNLALEVAVVSSSRKPINQDITKSWRARRAGRATPVLLVVIYDEKACLCGVSGDDPAILDNVDVGQAERLARSALALPDRLSALRFVSDALPTLETKLPGITNAGMLALHNLTTGAPNRPDWPVALQKSTQAAGKEGEALLHTLDYSITGVPLTFTTKTTD